MAPARRPLRVLFRVAAGPRVGFGHLVRAVSLAEALCVPARLSVRGSHASTTRTARCFGARLVGGGAPGGVLETLRPDVLVLDDRVARETAPWRRAARRLGIPIASIHDLGLGLGDADLVVDGSIGSRVAAPSALVGPRYAILNPRTLAGRAAGSLQRPAADVVVALGGGPRRTLAVALARRVIARRPSTRVGIAAGFVTAAEGLAPSPAVRWVKPAQLGRTLAGAQLAVVAGGVTLYECLALGVPSVAVAVVRSQRPTVSALAAYGASVDGGAVDSRGDGERALDALAEKVVELLDDGGRRASLVTRGRGLVDGRGAARVAAAIRRMAGGARNTGGQ